MTITTEEAATIRGITHLMADFTGADAIDLFPEASLPGGIPGGATHVASLRFARTGEATLEVFLHHGGVRGGATHAVFLLDQGEA